MKIIASVICTLFIATLFTSCSNKDYPTETALNIDFSKYKTYAFLPTDDTFYTRLVNKDTLEHTLARVAIQELTKKGYTMSKENPDCYFKYRLVLNRTYDVNQQSEMVYQPGTYTPAFDNQARIYYFSSDNRPEVYAGKMEIKNMREGTLVIDMIDSKTKEVIWRSTHSSKREEDNLPTLQMVADVIVPNMLKKLPKK
jgi:hypothetical protein